MKYKSSVVNKEVFIEVLRNLYRVKKTFPWSSLAFILKPDDLINFLDVFGGTTLEIPPKEDFIKIIQYSLVRSLSSTIHHSSEEELFELAKAANSEALYGLSKKQYLRLFDMLN